MLDRIPIWLVTFPFGLLLFVFGLWRFIREIQPYHWSRVQGKITSSHIEKRRITIRWARGYVYIPLVEYEYNYKDQVYQSSRRNLSNYESGNQATATKTVHKYPANATITVFVNPKSPAKAVLEKGITPVSWIFVAFGIFVLLMSVMMQIRP